MSENSLRLRAQRTRRVVIVSIVFGILLVIVLATNVLYVSRGGAFVLAMSNGDFSINSGTSVIGTSPWSDGFHFWMSTPARWLGGASWGGSWSHGWYLIIPSWVWILATALGAYAVFQCRKFIALWGRPSESDK
jgi:hypothetical protein